MIINNPSFWSLIIEGLSFFHSLYLSFQDIKHKSISLISLIIWLILSLAHGYFFLTDDFIFIKLIAVGVALCFLQLYAYKVQKQCLGSADAMILFSLCFWLQIDHLPYFFIGIGFVSLIWGLRKKMSLVPLLPVIFFNLWILYFFM